MANSFSLVWDLIAVDHASGTFGRVGASADGASGGVKRLLEGFGLLAAGTAVAAAVKQAAEFQKQMLLVQTQAGATAQEVRNMTPAILSLAGQVAQAPEALANSLYHVESTGLRGKAALDAVRIAAEGAKVGNADLEQTTNALTATIASGMLPATETYAQAMGQLNTIVGSGDMKMQDLNDSLSTGLLVTVKQYGVTLNDVGAALADFGDNNLRGADAATRLRMAVQAMESPAKTGQAALEKIGVTASQLAHDMATGGLNKALTDLHTHLVDSGIAADQWGQVLTDAFTKKAGQGILTLVGTFDRFEQKYQEVSKGADSFGAAWDATTKTAAFQFSALKDSVDAVGIQIGTKLLPIAGGFASWLSTTGIPNVEHFWSSLQQFTQTQGFQTFLRDAESLGSGALQAVKQLGSYLIDLGQTILPPIVSAGGNVLHFLAGLPGPIQAAAVAFAALRIAAGKGMFDDLLAGLRNAGTAASVMGQQMSTAFGVAKAQQVDTLFQATRVFAVSGVGEVTAQSALAESAVGRLSGTLAGFGAAAGEVAKGGLNVLKSAGQGVINMLGGPWGAALLTATAAYMSFEDVQQKSTDQTEKWVEALKKGGDAATQAAAQIQAATRNVDTSNFGYKFLTTSNSLIGSLQQLVPGVNMTSTAMREGAKAAENATQSYKDWYNSLSVVDQKQQDLNQATANLQSVLKTHAANSLAVTEAENKVSLAQQDVTYWTKLMSDATQTASQKAQALSQAELDLAGNSVAVKQSYDEFTASLQQYQKDAVDPTLKGTAQLTVEQDSLNQSALGVAQAAGTAGEAWAKANGVSDTSTASSYAQLLALQKVAQAMGTDTPAAVTSLITSLEASVAQGHLTQQQMDGITAAVDGIPGQKNVDVTADTSQAQRTIDGFLKSYQNVQYTGSAIVVNGRVVANADGNIITAWANGGFSPMSSSVAQVVKPGTMRLIGDNPVADEAFIPLNKSPRSHAILSEAASRMGYGLHAMAAGGITEMFPVQPSQAMLNSVKASIGAMYASAVPGGSGGAAQWAGLVLQALAMEKQPASLLGSVLRRMNQESGGNPNAINLWDSNAAAGDPSRGLMQVIGSTFSRYHAAGTSWNIYDPLANVLASMNYALARYGSLSAAYDRAGGYKLGTNYVPTDQFAFLHKGEAVVPASQNQGAPYKSPNLTVYVQIGNETIEATAVRVVDNALGQIADVQHYAGV